MSNGSAANRVDSQTDVHTGFRHSRYLVLAAMLFTVAMLFIDQTIISIAAPTIQEELKLSDQGVQWIVNGYLLSLSAFFALGGRLSDILGHKRMAIIGSVIFAGSSALCGLTPRGTWSEAWMVGFRVVQGFGGAIMFPAALALVVAVFPLSQRGRALALFFGITGAFTAVGPLAGGYLTAWNWRAIFWVNIPVAVLAVALTLLAKIDDPRKKERLDWLGAILVAVGMGLAVLGFQQSSQWGWSSLATWGAIAAGTLILVLFVFVETRVAFPLIRVTIFRGRAFSVDNGVLFLVSAAFVPVFFFISMYAQISLGYSAINSGLFLMWFFLGFVVAAQFGGRALDRAGAKRPMLIGCAVAAVGFGLWAMKTPSLSANAITPYVILTGAGIGLMFGPANTDAVNRAINASYGEVSGITQTIRYFGSSIGMAVLGTLMINQLTSGLVATVTGYGIPSTRAEELVKVAMGGGGSTNLPTDSIPPQLRDKVIAAIQSDFAAAIQYVFYGMAILMAVSFIIGLFHPGGKQEQLVVSDV